MTTHATTPLTLPTPHDYGRAADSLQDAYDAVETIEWQLGKVSDAYETDHVEQSPSPADVGELFGFVDDVDRLTIQLTTKRDELRRRLDGLNLMRRDGA